MSLASSDTASVRKVITVRAPQAVAFDVFTRAIHTWWPMPSHHIGKADCASVVLEPHAGGRWFERGVDGSECDWGRVLAWEPPGRLLLCWQISAAWSFDSALHTEVEVWFTALDAGSTRVELEHRGLEAYGAQALAMRDAFASPNGWAFMLEQFAVAAAG